MDFQKVQEIVFKTHEFPKNIEFDEQIAVIALKGIAAYLHEGAYTKEDASELKAKLAEHLGSEKSVSQTAHAVSEEAIQCIDNIRFGVLLRADPRSLLIQSCKCISLLTSDSGVLYRQVMNDCRELYRTEEFPQLSPEEERAVLEKDFERLTEKIQQTHDADSKHILARAKNAMEMRLEKLKEESA